MSICCREVYAFYYLILGRPTDQQMMVIKKIVYYIHRLQQKGICNTMESHMRIAIMRTGGRASEWKLWTSDFIVVSLGKNMHFMVSRLRTGCLK